MSRVEVRPIAEADLPAVGQFLHTNLNARISAREWALAARTPWTSEAPNLGFMLNDADSISGVYLAFYSTRTIAGRSERFCNLGAWCVRPRYRLYSIQLLKALLAQPELHFTDLSPSGNTIPVNERLKFKRIDTTTVLMTNLPWPSFSGRIQFFSDPFEIESLLTGHELQIFRDHLGARAANHLVIADGDEVCYVIFRRDRRKGIPAFASVLYVSNRELFHRAARNFGHYLLFQHGIPATLMELRVVGREPPGALLLRSSRPKMFKSNSLEAEQIDNLYSELMCVAW